MGPWAMPPSGDLRQQTPQHDSPPTWVGSGLEPSLPTGPPPMATLSCLDFSRFCVGDKFFLKNNMILCQMDYEEGQLNGSFEAQVQ